MIEFFQHELKKKEKEKKKKKKKMFAWNCFSVNRFMNELIFGED